MRSYSELAGGNLDRLAALSDGVFAVAMTLLVLEIHVPNPSTIHSERDLWVALVALLPRFATFLMSVLTLGIFWVGQQTQLNHLSRGTRELAWLHIGFLAIVCVVPFSTELLAVYWTYRLAVFVYWLNLVALGLAVLITTNYASRAGLFREDAPSALLRAVRRRVFVGQALYAVGMALCVFGTGWSVGFIFFSQLNWAIAPRFLRRFTE